MNELNQKPEVFIIATTTIDGYIARSSDELTNWSSKEDKAHFVKHTKDAGVMILGASTFKTFPKPLKDRHHVIYSRSEKFEEKWPDGNVETTSLPPQEIIDVLAKRGFTKIAICGGSSIYSLFMNAGVVTKLYLTIEPIAFGDGVKLFSGPISNIKNDMSSSHDVSTEHSLTSFGQKLELESNSVTENGTVFLTYKIKH